MLKILSEHAKDPILNWMGHSCRNLHQVILSQLRAGNWSYSGHQN